ncbi:hypothetical protein MNBD_GAMMA09-849 [hydrothermal vent metagenome]|uniref:Uncharacterized protein n=1 Tax=hydrothermal vent metagenome TaxID=652676 RepID=A0A3B0XJN0_9ZZZZ
MLQFMKLMHKTFITIVGCAVLSFSTLSFADEDSSEELSFAPEVPHPTNGTTECVRPEDDMKANHMKYILHQRDETMHKGIRTDTFALHECINCHVEKNSKARFGDSEHFCSSCHNYVGVSIDCFQCHNDRPSEEDHDHNVLNNKSSLNQYQVLANNPESATTKGAVHE